MDAYDVLVIGTGPAGEGAAMMAAKSGKRVAVVERFAEVGGGCTHWATIPSKALRQAASTLRAARDNPLLQSLRAQLHIDYPTLLSSASGVIEAQATMRRRFYERNRVLALPGAAWFVDAHTLQVRSAQGAAERVSAEHIVIATGSRPYHPPELDFSHPRVRDSDTILQYQGNPFVVAIFGAGVIGCEYASIFLSLGCKVTLINTQQRLLSFLDDEITEALSYHLHEQGCVIHHHEHLARLQLREADRRWRALPTFRAAARRAISSIRTARRRGRRSFRAVSIRCRRSPPSGLRARAHRAAGTVRGRSCQLQKPGARVAAYNGLNRLT